MEKLYLGIFRTSAPLLVDVRVSFYKNSGVFHLFIVCWFINLMCFPSFTVVVEVDGKKIRYDICDTAGEVNIVFHRIKLFITQVNSIINWWLIILICIFLINTAPCLQEMIVINVFDHVPNYHSLNVKLMINPRSTFRNVCCLFMVPNFSVKFRKCEKSMKTWQIMHKC